MPITLMVYSIYQAICSSAGRCETATSAMVQSRVFTVTQQILLSFTTTASGQRRVEGGSGVHREDEYHLLPGSHHRDMFAAFQGREGGFYSLSFVSCIWCCHAEQLMMATAKGMGLLSKCSWWGTGVGAKATG